MPFSQKLQSGSAPQILHLIMGLEHISFCMMTIFLENFSSCETARLNFANTIMNSEVKWLILYLSTKNIISSRWKGTFLSCSNHQSLSFYKPCRKLQTLMNNITSLSIMKNINECFQENLHVASLLQREVTLVTRF